MKRLILIFLIITLLLSSLSSIAQTIVIGSTTTTAANVTNLQDSVFVNDSVVLNSAFRNSPLNADSLNSQLPAYYLDIDNHTDKVYCTMGFDDSAFVLTMTQNNFVRIENTAGTLWSEGVNVGDLVVTGDSIQVTTAGDYEISWDLCFSGANADEYHIHIFIDGVFVGNKGAIKRGMASNKIGSTSSHTILTIGAGSWIGLQIENTANNNDATFVSGDIIVKKL